MSDIAINLVDNCYQLEVLSGDLRGDDGLQTAVIISLFTNRRVSPAEIPDGLKTQEGWWGDLFPEVEGDQIGSTFWIYSRSKISSDLIPLFENAANQALDWMIRDGLADSIESVASFDRFNRLVLNISITEPTGEENRFGFLWDGQELRLNNGL